MKKIRLKGVVFSGRGEGTKFIELSWVKEQITKKLGFTPHPGTLNIKLTEGEHRYRTLLEKTKGIEISPAKGFCRGKCFKACLGNNIKCAIVIPESIDYPKNVIEVIAPINLREKLRLADGESIEVKILLEN